MNLQKKIEYKNFKLIFNTQLKSVVSQRNTLINIIRFTLKKIQSYV